MTRDDYRNKYPEYRELLDALSLGDPIDFAKYSRLPGITEEKLKSLHEKFIAARKKG